MKSAAKVQLFSEIAKFISRKMRKIAKFISQKVRKIAKSIDITSLGASRQSGADGNPIYSAREITPSDSPSRGEKVLRDGQLYLMYEGRMYDVQGRRIRE